MTGTKEIDITICDFCKEKDTYGDKCLGCGKDVCFGCERDESIFKIYPHSLWCDGSGDGQFCLECDKKFTNSHAPNIWLKYRRMQHLRQRYFEVVGEIKSKADLLEKSIEDEKKKFI